MASYNQTGRAAPISMADFNARARGIAASTDAIEKGKTNHPRPTRFRRDVNGGIVSVPKEGKTAG